MRTTWLVVMLGLVAGRAAEAQVSVPPFTFQVPAGWVNLSPGAPETNFAGLPPAIVAQARQLRFMAMDLAGAGDGFAENVNLQLVSCTGRFTPELMDQVASQAPAQIQRMAPGSRFQIIEKGVLSVGGVMAGRMVFDLDLAGGPSMRQLQYQLPAGSQCAILTYSSTPGDFARYLPMFEAAARATTGLSEPPSRALGLFSRIGGAGLRGALIGGIAGCVAALVVALMRKKKKAGGSPPPR